MRKLKKHEFFIAAGIAFVIVGLVIYGIVAVYNYFFGMHLMNTGDYAPVTQAGEYNIVYHGEFQGKAIEADGEYYLDMEVINEEWADGMLFYAEDVEKVLYTTPTKVSESDVDREDFKKYQGQIYMRAEKAREMFGMQYHVNQTDSLVALLAPSEKLAQVEKYDTYLLVTANDEERNYVAELRRGDEIVLLGEEQDGYYSAMSQGGHVGYVKADRISVSASQISRKMPPEQKGTAGKLVDGYISLAWQQVYSSEFTSDIYEEIASASYYINIVSPTWFRLNEEGGIDSLANENYVSWAHNQGLSVWALFDNAFDDEWTYKALYSTANRQQLVHQLLEYCEQYDLDGINVDFEQMSEKTDRLFIQFLRELSIVLRTNGYLLTIDCAVPSEWTDYYQRDAMNDLCDYVIVMAYDEHYAGDTVAGSTASYSFTKAAIENMLQEGVSQEKLVLGVPYYTRVWMGDENLRSEAVGMDTAQRCIEENNLTLVFDNETSQNYAEGMVDGTLYRIWLEDETSMRWRLKMTLDYQLAGVAAWSLGFENYDNWRAYEGVLYG